MKKIIPVLVLSLLIVWLLLRDHPSKTISLPHVVSFQSNDKEQPPKDLIKQTSSTQQQSEQTSSVEMQLTAAAETADSELSYLAVYRMQRSFKACEAIIYRLLQDEDDFDPVAEFQTRIKSQLEKNPHWPTTLQIQAVKRHAEKCAQLIEKIEGLETAQSEHSKAKKNNSYIQLRSQLNQHFSTMKPKTAKELEIADVLALSEIWQESYNKVIEISKGDEHKNQQQIDAIRTQINALGEERKRLSERSYDLRTPEESERIIAISGEVRQLEQQIIDLRHVDEAARLEAIEAFEAVNSMMFAKLKSSDPDVFFEAQLTLEQDRQDQFYFGHKPYKAVYGRQIKVPFIEYVSPGDVIKAWLGFQDNETFALVIHYATQLYHCELGADCGSDGEWLPYYCHVGYMSFHERACDGDLPTFYQSYYLNHNQWQDVQYVLNIIRSLYEI